jgi:heme exporter protein A
LNPPLPLLELRDLAVERDERLLFTGMSLAFDAGDIVQILGPNGAGKTTLLRALAQLNTDYQGEIHYLGQPLADCAWDYACDCLYLGHLAGIKKSLTPRENLQWYSAQVGSRMPIDEALERVGLKGYEDTTCYQLSAGQLRRVALARLHLSNARIWILDEPFTAIDKLGVKALETLIIEQSARGGLVLLTSHQDLNLDSLKMVNLSDYLPRKAAQATSFGVEVSFP